jgi:hypothetical protein
MTEAPDPPARREVLRSYLELAGCSPSPDNAEVRAMSGSNVSAVVE